MSGISSSALVQVLEDAREPLLIVRVDHTDWPVAFANAAFASIAGADTVSRPIADVIEAMVGRELALEISESLRAGQETGFPVEAGGREYLLSLKPLVPEVEDAPRYCAMFWRSASTRHSTAGAETHHALLKAKRRIRDLTREDPVTGLLNERAFNDVLEHDWAVASREQSTIALVLFTLDDFAAYVDVFGRHAADSCLRRVGQAVRRCLRRASDVVARLDDARFVVLSHASDEPGVREFAERISTAVRELGLHHPRSKSGRFVTVSHRVYSVTAGPGIGTAGEQLQALFEPDSARG